MFSPELERKDDRRLASDMIIDFLMICLEHCCIVRTMSHSNMDQTQGGKWTGKLELETWSDTEPETNYFDTFLSLRAH